MDAGLAFRVLNDALWVGAAALSGVPVVVLVPRRGVVVPVSEPVCVDG